MNDSTISLIRSFLKIGGGYFLAKGLVKDDGQIEIITSGLVAVLGVVWGCFHRSSGDSNQPPASIPRQTSLLLVLALAGGLCFSGPMGCSMTPKRALYVTQATTEVSIEKALSGWGDYVAKYHPPVSQEQAVSDALDKYKAAAVTAVDASRLYSAASSDGTNSVSSKIIADLAQQAASDRLADVVNLIRSFGVTGL